MGKVERVGTFLSDVNKQVVECLQVVAWVLDESTDIKSTDVTRLPGSCLFEDSVLTTVILVCLDELLIRTFLEKWRKC